MARNPALLKLLLLIAVLAGAAAFIQWQQWIDLESGSHLAASIRGVQTTPGNLALFTLLFAIGTTLGVPGTIFVLAGGALFGLAVGGLLNWIGTIAGAAGGYWLARALGRDALKALIGKREPRMNRLLHDNSFWTILRLRLLPLTPYNILNFAAGLAAIPARGYFLGTAVGTLPVILIYTFFADTLLTGVESEQQGTILRIAAATSLLLLLSFLPRYLHQPRSKRPPNDRQATS